ncbi:MAG: LysR family transcriptional regulator [Alphaproteobacteria bacterium]|nr:MAG: LysR family transcriptional regulator [Alphaproteobacteria bacterium]
MDWDKLRVFKAVAEAGSFTHAGDELNLSQSAISRQISSLENSLGLPLFHRHARGLILTEQGDMLLQTTNDVFNRLQQVETRLSDSRMLPEGPLTITTVEFIASTWLAPQIGKFHQAFPDIQVTMLLDDRVFDLGKREADVALRLQPAGNSDLIEKHLTTINFALCTSKRYLEQHDKPKTLEDLKNHVMIAYPPNTQTPFLKPNWAFNRFDIEVQNNPKILLINSMHARYAAIKSGIGIAALPRYIVRQDDDLEILFPDLDIPSVDLYFVYPQERRNSKRITVLKDFLFEYIKNVEQNT